MVKILLLAIIVWLLFVVIRRYNRSLHSGPASGTPDSALMVQCRHCGLHIPRDDSIAVGGDYYCCEEHRQQSAPDV